MANAQSKAQSQTPIKSDTPAATAGSGFVRVARPLRFPAGNGAGQRGADRRTLTAVADVREAGTDDAPLPLHLSEVSATGAFVASDLLLPVGAALELSFGLPDASRVEALARVVRVQHRGGRPGMGIVFDRVPANARAALRRYTAWN